MSAPRQAIAALWAAVWVRWRLLALRGRRLLGGGGPAAAAGSGYYLSSAEIPVEGVDFELLDLPPELEERLDAARAELVDHARAAADGGARRRRVRRHRTASVATAAVVSLAALGAGANALVSGSTGVPAVDRLLGIYETGLEKPGGEDRQAPGGREIQPRDPFDGTTVRAPLGDGRTVVRTSFVARDGSICTATTLEPEAGPLAAMNCLDPRYLDERLASGGLLLGTSSLPGGIVLRGFVDEGVVGVTAGGPSGPLQVRLGKAWDPEGADTRPMRAFVAVGPHPRRGDGTLADTIPQDFEVEGKDADGRRVRVLP